MYIENYCSGCGACANICPVNAITMKMDEEGFLRPVIESEKCINCESCMRVCPVLKDNVKNSNWKEPHCYAFSAEKELINKSSSGGLFTVLAEKTLKENGIVFGAAFDEKFCVKHEGVSDLADLDKLRLSKYVQSEVGDSISKAANHLKSGKKVLYTGTMCQIAGLKSYLREKKIDDGNLITVDLICHGAPSPGIFHDYLDQEFGIDNIDKLYMRRRTGWSTCLDVYMKNGESSERRSIKSVFMLAFLKDVILRKSCYNCKYATLPRVADITLGDFWGVKKFKLGENFENKCSVAVVNNEKGKSFLEESVKSANYSYSFLDLTAKGITVDQLNGNIKKSSASDRKKRDRFFSIYNGKNFKEAVYKAMYPNCVGMVLYMSDNYGSTATNLSLFKAIERLGYTPLILNHLIPIEGVSAPYAKKYLRLSDGIFEKEEYKDLDLFCDSYVLGSDQSLRWDFRIVFNHFEWLFMAFAGAEKRKIAYAASYGPDRKLNDPVIKKMYTKCFERFTDFSVREDSAVGMSKREFNRNADWMIDPVFLIEKEDFRDIVKKSKVNVGEPYLLAYLRFHSDKRIKLIKEQAKANNLKLVIICDADRFADLKAKYNSDEIVEKPEFVDWLAYYANADRIITDSFHGTCFSIIFHKKYAAIQAGTKERFTSLANVLRVEDPAEVNIYESEDAVLSAADPFKAVDFNHIDECIKSEKTRCLNWLNNALKKEVKSDEQGSNESFVEYVKAVKAYTKKSREFENYKKKNG